MYIPATISAQYFEIFFDLLSDILQEYNSKIIVIGDFNITQFKNLNASDNKVQLVTNFTYFHNITQINTVLKVSGPLVDLVFTDVSDIE